MVRTRSRIGPAPTVRALSVRPSASTRYADGVPRPTSGGYPPSSSTGQSSPDAVADGRRVDGHDLGDLRRDGVDGRVTVEEVDDHGRGGVQSVRAAALAAGHQDRLAVEVDRRDLGPHRRYERAVDRVGLDLGRVA